MTDGDRNQVGAAALSAVRQPHPTTALVEAHVGPTKQYPKADVLVWLCPPCAIEVTDPNGHQPREKDRQR